MKKFFLEFKAFILKGNVMNLAVGVLIGAAFQKVVSSLTENILAPILSFVTGSEGASFATLSFDIFGTPLKYGAFLVSIVDFILMAFIVFLLVRGMNRIFELGKKKETPAEEAPPTKECPFCKSSIAEAAVRCPQCTSILEGGNHTSAH